MSLMDIIARSALREAEQMDRALDLATEAKRAGLLVRDNQADVRDEIIRLHEDLDPQAVTIAVDEVSRSV